MRTSMAGQSRSSSVHRGDPPRDADHHRNEGRLPLGATVALSFKIPSHDQAIEVSGEVRWSTDQDTGLQFGGLRAREVWELTRYFESL